MSKSSPLVEVAPDHDTLAAAVAARSIAVLCDALAARPEAHFCLTGGSIGTASLAAIAASPACAAVDWARVHIWWSDERFEPTGDPVRNETGARAALLDQVALTASHVHPMPASGGRWANDVDAAAAAYADELLRVGLGAVPDFDVLLLGVGPDGHVASLFPAHAALADLRVTCGVINSPKPPPTRITFTLPTIARAREVWLVASGAEKSEAMGRALNDGEASLLPAALVRGSTRTLALLDREAAVHVAPVAPVA